MTDDDLTEFLQAVAEMEEEAEWVDSAYEFRAWRTWVGWYSVGFERVPVDPPGPQMRTHP